MPNPSEEQRKHEEYEDALAISRDLTFGKATRERYLREVRRLGKELGYNTKPYNGHGE